MRGRLNLEGADINLGGLTPVMHRLKSAQRIIIVACGTSWHAGLLGEYLIEQMARVPVEVEYGSEFRYRQPLIFDDDVMIAISQSGTGRVSDSAAHGPRLLLLLFPPRSASSRDRRDGGHARRAQARQGEGLPLPRRVQ